MTTLSGVGVLIGLVVALPATSHGQAGGSQDSTGRTTLEGVYSASQAEKGQQTYRKNCAACHAAAAYTGSAFRRLWTGRSVYDFFNLIRTTMPNDKPGKLGRGQYAEIMAYVLKLNGFPAGEDDLPDDDEPLKQIRIEMPVPAKGPTP